MVEQLIRTVKPCCDQTKLQHMPKVAAIAIILSSPALQPEDDDDDENNARIDSSTTKSLLRYVNVNYQ